MGQNTRYGIREDLSRYEHVQAVPSSAYGPEPLEWFAQAQPVWIWLPWAARAAERVPGFATASNDRVVCVEWMTPTGTRSTTVWRNAVRRRKA